MVSIGSIDFSRHDTTVTAMCTGGAIGETHATFAGVDPLSPDSEPTCQDRYADIDASFELTTSWDLSAATATPASSTLRLMHVTIAEFQIWTSEE